MAPPQNNPQKANKTALLEIVYEDSELLVVNKPADLVCHPTKGDAYSSLISRARIYFLSTQPPGHTANPVQPPACPCRATPAPVPHLVHRLDRETSGLVVIAKNALAARELGKIWETRTVRKEYLAIVHGWVTPDQGIIDAPLGKDQFSRVAIKDCVRADGHPAQTQYIVEKRFSVAVPTDSEPMDQPQTKEFCPGEDCPERPFSLLRVEPLTGRKHQIRIHLQHLGHPLVGDKLYGGDPDLYLALVERRLTEEQRVRLILPCHALHAHRIQFDWHGQNRDFGAPPEAAFQQLLAAKKFPIPGRHMQRFLQELAP